MNRFQYRYFTGVIVVAACLPRLAGAQSTVLSWADVQLAAENHPALKVARNELEAADAEIALARQYPNPETEFSAGQGRAVDGDETALIWGVELVLPVRSPGVYRSEKQSARANRKIAGALADQTRLNTLRQVRELYLQIAADRQRVVVLTAAQTQLEKLVEIARVRVDKGEARPMELLRLEMEREKNRADLQATINLAAARRETLALWLELTLPDDYTVNARLEQFPTLATESVALNTALARHPQLTASRALEERAQTAVKGERHKRLPDLGVGGFYEQELDAANFGATLSFSLPLWNWNSGSIARAEAEQSAAHHGIDLARREITAAVHQSHARASGALKRARSYSEVIMPKAEESASTLEKMYRIGEVNLMELLDSRRSRIETQTEMIEASLAYHLAHLELSILMGGIFDEE